MQGQPAESARNFLRPNQPCYHGSVFATPLCVLVRYGGQLLMHCTSGIFLPPHARKQAS